MSLPPRAQLEEKTAYVPRQKPEMFMVPLLKEAIEEGIARHAPMATGGGRALDVGCGGQPFRATLEARGWRYFGLDMQAAPGVTLDFTCALDGPLPPPVLAEGEYDFILCTEVLEHVPRWEAAFDNLCQLLAPGGRVLITSPHFYILHEEPYDFFRPTVHAFKYFAQKHGLTVVEWRQLGDAWDIVGTLLSCCRFEAVPPASWFRRVLAKVLWRCRNVAFRMILKGRIRRLVSFRGPTYLSNYVVLQKPMK